MKKFYDILNKFANDHTLAKGVDCSISANCTGYTAKDGGFAKFEDVVLLSRIVDGAESFCYFLSRNNYKIVKGK